MSTFKNSLLIAAALLSWAIPPIDQTANAQISIQRGSQNNYGNQRVYRGSPRVYSQPTYRSTQPYVQPNQQVYVVPSQQNNNGFGSYPAPYQSPNARGQVYESYRPTYTNPPVYGNPVYGNQVYGNPAPNGFYYNSPSQQRGANVGGAIGNAIGGNAGANVGAAIGAAVRGR